MLRWMRLKSLLFVLLIAHLGGCAGTSVQPEVSADWPQHLQQLQALSSWRATGKVALRSASAQETANLIWQQSGAATQLQLSGPFGAGATQVYSDGHQLTVEQGDDKRTVDISTPTAVLANTGWDLPLRSLPYWLKGMPDPTGEADHLATDPGTGHLTQLQQFGWNIRFEQYRSHPASALPGRLLLVKDDTRVTVLIRQWQTRNP